MGGLYLIFRAAVEGQYILVTISGLVLLMRLQLQALQSHPAETTVIPHSDAVALRLAQCLNPILPSGVHQKALEVYEYIFSTIGV